MTSHSRLAAAGSTAAGVGCGGTNPPRALSSALDAASRGLSRLRAALKTAVSAPGGRLSGRGCPPTASAKTPLKTRYTCVRRPAARTAAGRRVWERGRRLLGAPAPGALVPRESSLAAAESAAPESQRPGGSDLRRGPRGSRRTSALAVKGPASVPSLSVAQASFTACRGASWTITTG